MVPTRVLTIVLIGLVGPSSVLAQEAEPKRDHTSLAPGDRVKVRFANDTELIGRLLRRGDRDLWLEHRVSRSLAGSVYDSTRVRLDAVAALWVQEGRQTRRGAIIGGIAGTLFGLGFVAAAAEASGDCEPACWARAVPVFAVFGAGVGAVLGLVHLRWESVRTPR